MSEESLNIELSDYMRLYADKTSQIEIIDDHGLSVEHSFIILPYCVLNSKKEKDDFIYKIDMTNTSTTCHELMIHSKVLIKQMECRYRLEHNYG